MSAGLRLDVAPLREAAKRLAAEGAELGVINARFVKPLDAATILAAVADTPLVVTVEEGVLMGGFGSTVLEAAADTGLDASHLHRLGIPDRFIEHGPRPELLADLGLDAAGIVRSCQQWLGGRRAKPPPAASVHKSSRTVGNALRGVTRKAVASRDRWSAPKPQVPRGTGNPFVPARRSDFARL